MISSFSGHSAQSILESASFNLPAQIDGDLLQISVKFQSQKLILGLSFKALPIVFLHHFSQGHHVKVV